MKRRFKTIRAYAAHLLLTVIYVDSYGRNIGYAYLQILDLLKIKFPNSVTTVKELQKIAYEIGETNRLPVRRRSIQRLARDYAKTLLLVTNADGVGLTYLNIAQRVKGKFPGYWINCTQMSSIAGHVTRAGTPMPPRSKLSRK